VDALKWTTETRRLGDLIPWESNPRQLTKEQASRLRESITEFGYSQLYEIEPDNTIIDGHQRDEIMLRMDEFGADAEIEVRVAPRKFTVEQRKKYIALKHRGAVGEWDWDAMHNLYDFEELDDWGFDADELLAHGFEPDEPDPPEDPGADIDRAEELREKWGVESGQLWQLGEHRLICGDCTDGAVVDAVMMGERAGGVVTDPPYNIGKDEWDNIDFIEFHTKWYSEIDNGIPIYIFSGSLHSGLWWQIAPPRALYCWYKPNGQGNNPMRGTTKWEPILAWNPVQDKQTDFIEHNNEYGEGVNYQHLTPKPIGLIEKLIDKTSGIIYEPFCGSGTCIIACERLNRKCRAVEISPAYVAVAIERWAEMTGQEPVLVR